MGQYRSSFANANEEHVDLTANAVTVDNTHLGKTIYATGTGAQTYTVPQDSVFTVAPEIGDRVRIVRWANQTLTVVAGSSATVVGSGASLTARARYSEIILTKVAANSWRLGGDVATS